MRIGFILSSFFVRRTRIGSLVLIIPIRPATFNTASAALMSFPTALRTLDTHHFGGLIYLVHLIVIYTMMYLIPTEISLRTRGTTLMHMVSTRMVTSTTATAVTSTVPTV